MRNKLYLGITFCAICITLALFNSPGYARPFFGRTIFLPLQKVAPGNGEIVIDFTLPLNHEFAEEAPSRILIRTKHPEIFKTVLVKPKAVEVKALPYSIATAAKVGETIVAIDARIHFCDEVEKICLSDFIRIKFPIQIQIGAPSKLSLHVPLKSKKTH